MPTGPQGEKRPADVIGAIVMVAKIATGETEDPKTKPRRQRAAQAGGEARAQGLTKKVRTAIALNAASV